MLAKNGYRSDLHNLQLGISLIFLLMLLLGVVLLACQNGINFNHGDVWVHMGPHGSRCRLIITVNSIVRFIPAKLHSDTSL